MKRLLASLIALGATVLVAPAAPAFAQTAATEVTFRVEGSVRSASNVTGVAVGNRLVLEYTFAPATPSDYTTDVFAIYPAVTSMTATVGDSYRLEATSGTISVADNYGLNGGSGDEYRAQFTGLTESPPIGPVLPGGGSLPPSEVFLQMTDAAEQGLADGIVGLDLPSTAPDLGLFGDYPPYFAISFTDPACDDDVFDECPSGLMEATVDSITVVSQGPDADGDGVADDIGTGVAGGFHDGGNTGGQILTGTGILVEDASAPAGVRITTTEAATVQVCGFNLSLSAGSDVVITCGSVTAVVTAGTTTIDLNPGSSVTIPAGGDVTVDQMADGDYEIVNNGTEPISITRAGVTSTLAGGATEYSAPQQRSDCLKGGWKKYGLFADQGRCIAAVSVP